MNGHGAAEACARDSTLPQQDGRRCDCTARDGGEVWIRFSPSSDSGYGSRLPQRFRCLRRLRGGSGSCGEDMTCMARFRRTNGRGGDIGLMVTVCCNSGVVTPGFQNWGTKRGTHEGGS